MPISAAALRELHGIHRQLTELRSRLSRGPKQVAAAAANVKKTEQACEQARETFKRTRITSDDRQLQLKQREDRIKDLQSKLNGCSSNREYQALKEQIAADEQANSVLQDEILELLEKLDEQQDLAKEAENDLERTRGEAEKVQGRVAEEKARLEAELERVTGELQRAEDQLPLDFKADYQRISRARGEDALAEVAGESCGSCYNLLSPQTMNELLLSKPVFCKSCGALMYLPEEGAASEDA